MVSRQRKKVFYSVLFVSIMILISFVFYVYRPMSFSGRHEVARLCYTRCGRQRACSLKNASGITQKAVGLKTTSGVLLVFV